MWNRVEKELPATAELECVVPRKREYEVEHRVLYCIVVYGVAPLPRWPGQ